MFKVADVDALAGAGDEIELSPAGDQVDLSKPAPTKPAGKEDTVITTAGISIFDDEELEIEPADPMAKTQIAPSLEEQLSTEGVGSGSGLLDLTRESDDTSLGEVLDHIDVDTAPSSGVANMTEASISSEAPMVIEPPTVVEEADAASGAFSGMVVGACLLMMVIGVVGVAVIQDMVPDFLVAMQNNLAIFLVVGVVVCGILAGVGFAIGKNMASRAAALQRIGS
jgi:hypothetical protein